MNIKLNFGYKKLHKQTNKKKRKLFTKLKFPLIFKNKTKPQKKEKQNE